MAMIELNELCKTLKAGSLKSKQAVFNRHYGDVRKAIGIYGWRNIVSFINSYTGENLSIKTYKNMLDRAKKKVESSPQPETKAAGKKVTTNAFSTIVKKEKLVHDNNPDLDALLDRLGAESGDLSDYLKVCFNSEPIANRAREAGVSIEEIQSWECPNQIRLGTRLSHFIRNAS
jgi:hypothetical protein